MNLTTRYDRPCSEEDTVKKNNNKSKLYSDDSDSSCLLYDLSFVFFHLFEDFRWVRKFLCLVSCHGTEIQSLTLNKACGIHLLIQLTLI